MILKFIWIKKHRALKDFNFNFCHDGEHQFNYDGKKMQLTDNNKSPIKFSEKILSLTAIAGKNGSGKSSFCEAVLYATATLQENSFGLEALFDGIVCIDKELYVHKDLIIENETEIIQNGYQIVRYKKSPLEKELEKRSKENFKGHIGFVYYSNNFDYKSYVEGNNLSNISTSNKLFVDHRYSNFVSHVDLEVNAKKTGDEMDSINIHLFQEHYKMLDFVLHFPEYCDFIDEKAVINLLTSYSGNNRFISLNSIDLNDKYLDEIEDNIFNSLCEKIIEEPEHFSVDRSSMIQLLFTLYKVNILSLTKNSNNYSQEEMVGFIGSNKIPQSIDSLELRELLVTYKLLLENSEFRSNFSVSQGGHYYNKGKDWRNQLIRNFWVNFSESNRNYLKKIMLLEYKILGNSSNVSHRITNYSLSSYLSGGQISYLSIFSRLFDVIKGYVEGDYSKNNLIIFLDEPETGFHPEWSKTLLNNLVKFINDHFNPFKIQLILTTHSPYLLSDLPKENIRLFNRVENESPKIQESKTNTFGANIYDLLHDSFFLEDGFIGSFAQAKIDEVFSELTNKLNDSKYNLSISQDAMKSIINIIGEPLIQRQLSVLYDRVFQEDLEMEIITKQIDSLQRLRDKKLGRK